MPGGKGAVSGSLPAFISPRGWRRPEFAGLRPMSGLSYYNSGLKLNINRGMSF